MKCPKCNKDMKCSVVDNNHWYCYKCSKHYEYDGASLIHIQGWLKRGKHRV